MCSTKRRTGGAAQIFGTGWYCSVHFMASEPFVWGPAQETFLEISGMYFCTPAAMNAAIKAPFSVPSHSPANWSFRFERVNPGGGGVRMTWMVSVINPTSTTYETTAATHQRIRSMSAGSILGSFAST